MLYILIFISFIFSEQLLKGYVFDRLKNPIKDVNIEVVGSSDGTISNNDGFFIIKLNKKETLKFSHIAYYDKEISNLNNLSNLTVFLENKDVSIDRIVVTSTKSARHIKDTPVLTHVISNREIENASYAGVKDMLEIAMPNVQMVASNHGDDRVKLQGLDNKYLTFLIDGDRVTGEYAGNLDFSMLNLSNVDRIEVIEGAMSTLYGSSAVGGVINVITKKNTSPFWLNINLLSDEPLIKSISLDSGVNFANFYYNLFIVNKKSEGYDLTPQSEFSKTLDEHSDLTFQHQIRYKLNSKNNFEFLYKDYASDISKYMQVFDQSSFSNIVVFDAPLNRYTDYVKKIKYNFKKSSDESLNIRFFNERYSKLYYYPYYFSNDFIEDGAEFKQGSLNHQEFNLEYDIKYDLHKFLIGFEYMNQKYSAYNIYDNLGEFLHESIFSGQEETKIYKSSSLYFHSQFSLQNKNQIAFGLRFYDSGDDFLIDFLPSKNSKVLSSVSFLIKGDSGFNHRLTYSSGYRNPSIKELYYEWTDHEPNIYGNPDLKSTKNNYLSLSLDKRSFLNDFSIDFYTNSISNMISTEYTELGLEYKNYNDVSINGINVHYFRKINNNSNLKFVYNFTDASSSSNEILEGISKHAFRLNLTQKIIDKLRLVVNVKYLGEKNNFNQEQDWIGANSIKVLEDYFLTDLYFIIPEKNIDVNFGIKNIFNYKDSSRFGDFSPDILSSYDPGRRFFIQLEFKFNNKYD